jgi:hypothetical protein
MSVYPIYLVLGNDGIIGAYAREDLLLIDLRLNEMAGQAARQVFKLNPETLTVTYEPDPKYAEFINPCAECEKKQKAAGAGGID